MTTQKNAAERIHIVLGGPHTHRGADKGQGDIIEVRPDQATNLIENHGASMARDAQIKAFVDADKD